MCICSGVPCPSVSDTVCVSVYLAPCACVCIACLLVAFKWSLYIMQANLFKISWNCFSTNGPLLAKKRGPGDTGLGLVLMSNQCSGSMPVELFLGGPTLSTSLTLHLGSFTWHR